MVLSGYYVCFSGFLDFEDDVSDTDSDVQLVTTVKAGGEPVVTPACDLLCQPPSLQKMKKLATSLNAVIQTKITKRTTVLVAGQGLTRKRLVADEQRIPVVSARWLESNGRLPLAECQVPLLHGYTFCATQMSADEERALALIINRNGGTFNRTLSAQTSMLFVPSDWLRHWRQQQQRHLTTCGSHASTSIGPLLPEKISFAWATNIPVVDYKRFLDLAALCDSAVGGKEKAKLRTDFDTIASVCALLPSVADGVVPPTQMKEHAQSAVAKGATEESAVKVTKDKRVKSEGLSYEGQDRFFRKRCRDLDDRSSSVKGEPGSRNGAHGEPAPRPVVGGDSPDAPDVVNSAFTTPKQGQRIRTEFHGVGAGGNKPMNSFEMCKTTPCGSHASGLSTNTVITACGRPSPDAFIECEASMGSQCSNEFDVFQSQGEQKTVVKVNGSSLVPEKTTSLTCEFFFSQSSPFLQIVLLHCTPKQLVECIRMSICCRFLRTPIVTPFTDVVVIGDEPVHDPLDLNAIAPLEMGVGRQRQQPAVAAFAQLRERICLAYSLPLERIVTVDWLKDCYQRMLTLNEDAITADGACGDTKFCAAPLPLSYVAPTNKYCLSSSVDAAVRFMHEQQPPKFSSEMSNPQQSQKSSGEKEGVKGDVKVNKSEVVATNQQKNEFASGSSEQGKGTDTEQKRYEIDVRLANQRVVSLLNLLGGAVDAVEKRCFSLSSALFCFVEQDFSRVELGVIRGLVNYGKGSWVKMTRDEWSRALSRKASVGTRDKNGCDELLEGQKEHDEINSSAIASVRQLSATHKRLYRECVRSMALKIDTFPENMAWLIEDEAPQQFSDISNCQRTVRRKPTLSQPQHVFYVMPHGDQRPTEVMLLGGSHTARVTRADAKNSLTNARHPLRYLPTVTQDYVLCSLAAQHLLEPGSCFLFYKPAPGKAERLVLEKYWRHRAGDADGNSNSGRSGHGMERDAVRGERVMVSPWIGPRRLEKAPTIGVSICFHCVMPQFDQEEESCKGKQEAAAVALRRVLLNCLAAAVGELDGRCADVFLVDKVTHVVVVDVASIFSSDMPSTGADPSHNFSTQLFYLLASETDVEKARSALLARSSKWPPGVQNSQLFPGLVEHVAAGRISLVGMEWLEASVAWGVFVDEARFALPLPKLHCQQFPQSAATPNISPDSAPLTPPGYPRQTDVTLLPFTSSERHSSCLVHYSPQSTGNYEFNFATPASTPGRVGLGTPQMQHTTAQHVPFMPIVLDAVCHESGLVAMMETDNDVSETAPLVPTSNDMCTKENAENVVKPNEMDDCMDFVVPVDRTLSFDENEGTPATGSADKSGNTPPARNILMQGSECAKAVQAMSQHLDLNTAVGRAGCAKRRQESQQQQPLRTSLPLPLPKSFHGSLKPPYTRRNAAGCLFIHIVKDLAKKEQLEAFCTKLSDSLPHSRCHTGDSAQFPRPCSFSQQHLHASTNPVGVVTAVKFVPTIREADVLVTHQLSQRESVLAAVAAGIWVVTSKALEDCERLQSFHPLHDLSVYEWCKELLPPDSPRYCYRIARQCRIRRLNFHATGSRLFDGKRCVFIRADTPLGVRRLHSLKNVVEAGGGVVSSTTFPGLSNEGEVVPNANGKNAMSAVTESGDLDEQGSAERCSAEAESRLLSKAASRLLDFILKQVSGWEEDISEACDHAHDIQHLKELIVLFDAYEQGKSPPRLQYALANALKDANEAFAQAKHQALKRLGCHRSPKEAPTCEEPTVFDKVNEKRSAGDASPSVLSPIYMEDGMPFAEVVRLYTSDWVALKVQQQPVSPFCSVVLSV
ncbi:twin BRCT domain [Trypanosoma vivax]|uniref:BRCT domain-containing protein n=1 Tax=Trypanosoma vivax (strain Y486) TaxID=1055687 RepID=G0TXL4_TRYVY|nr:hypothetical protein TRVL_04234 [Trypanosoma vivax]KAH8612637.1 twin BRCT domain [Trypanosoma vivax]CCC48705.1 conserved hypothetical protein [Trypanosoma vivax Y486]